MQCDLKFLLAILDIWVLPKWTFFKELCVFWNLGILEIDIDSRQSTNTCMLLKVNFEY